MLGTHIICIIKLFFRGLNFWGYFFGDSIMPYDFLSFNYTCKIIIYIVTLHLSHPPKRTQQCIQQGTSWFIYYYYYYYYIRYRTSYTSVLTIVAFSMERYLAICHPLHSYAMSGLKRAIRIIAVVWVISFFAALPFAMFTTVDYVDYPPGNWPILQLNYY